MREREVLMFILKMSERVSERRSNADTKNKRERERERERRSNVDTKNEREREML